MEYPKGSKNGRQYQPGAVWHEKFSAKGMFRNFPIIRSPTTAVETEGVKRTSIQTENRDEKTDSDNQRPGEFRSFLSRFPSPKLSANNNGGTSTASQGTTTQVITTTEDLFEAVHPLRRKNHTTKLISPKDGLFEVIFPSPESLADRPTITKFKLIPRVQPESLGIDEETDVKLLSETIGNRIENSTELNRANQLKPETKNPELWAHNQGFWHFTPTNTTEIPISNVTGMCFFIL